MANFAELTTSNIVKRVVAVSNEVIGNLRFPESNEVGANYLRRLFGEDSTWEQTSYNGSFRKNYAGEGFIFDASLDAFIPEKPFPSWELNTSTCQWEAPVLMPSDGVYMWDEPSLSWIK